MNMTRTLALALLLPAAALAQTLPATHVFSGLDATSARIRIERDSRRTYGPRFEAAAMRAPAAFEYFPGLKLPGQKEAFKRPAPAIRVVKPTFRLPEMDLGIGDVQDAVFFAETRLVRMRVYLKSSGDPLSKRWADHLRRYFDFLDRDGNGELNRSEAEFALSNGGVLQMLQTGYAYQRPDDGARAFADLDVDDDNKVSFDELAFYYSPSAARVIAAQASPFRDTLADTLTDELFKRFDLDKDGKLSESELTAVEKLFATADADEDECLTAPEIAPSVFTGRIGAVPRAAGGPAAQQPMTAFRPGNAPDSIIETIVTRYDRDKNLRLSRGENPFGEAAFDRLDRNGSGDVTVTELLAWKDLPPDLEIEMTLATKPEDGLIKLRPGSDGKPVALANWFRAVGDGTAVFTVGNQSIQLSCYSPPGVYSQAARSSMLAFPDQGRGFITEKDIAGPQFQAMRILFDMMDRDLDGKLSRAEFDAFGALQSSFTRLPLSLVYSAQTPSLFQFLDTNGDGRLSVREVRHAWPRLIALEPSGNKFVTRDALRPQGALRFGRAAEVVSSNPATMYTQPPTRVSGRGPLWFRKFDRNGDAELSRGEFPGPAAEFDRMDADHDGYVTVAEAEAADKRLRAADKAAEAPLEKGPVPTVKRR
jgi:Ca2+-binding EF-hand superfamily protein